MSRVAPIVLALAVMAAACGDDDTQGSPVPTNSALTTIDTPGLVTECVEPGLSDQLVTIAVLISDRVMADYRTVRHDPAFTNCQAWHDWSTDDCSGPIGSTGPAFDFTHPCHRHDFGYRNYKRVEAVTSEDHWNEAAKLAVDDQFLEDNREHCSARLVYEKQVCLAWAQTFYWAVRAFGT